MTDHHRSEKRRDKPPTKHLLPEATWPVQVTKKRSRGIDGAAPPPLLRSKTLQSDIAILNESPEIELAPLKASLENINKELRANADLGDRLKARIEELSLNPRN